MIHRRSFLTGLVSLLAAPAIVHAHNIMPIKPIFMNTFVPVSTYEWNSSHLANMLWTDSTLGDMVAAGGLEEFLHSNEFLAKAQKEWEVIAGLANDPLTAKPRDVKYPRFEDDLKRLGLKPIHEIQADFNRHWYDDPPYPEAWKKQDAIPGVVKQASPVTIHHQSYDKL